MELSELLLLLSLIGGTIYASISLTIQVLGTQEKEKGLTPVPSVHLPCCKQ